MKKALCIVVWALAATAQAQVHLDRPLVLSSADSAQRSIEGLSTATQGDALITLSDVRDGRYLHAQVSGTAAAIALGMQPACTAYRPGLSVRFVPNAVAAGAVTLNVDGLGPKRLLRADRGPIDFGQVVPGRAVEAVYADTCFVLHERSLSGCPTGFLPVNQRLCIQRNDTLSMSIYNASRWCQERGAQLCSWDEYIQGCTATQGQLEGLFNDWEWMDDSSDHTHTADQIGRWSCRGMRNIGAIENANNYGSVRCCYRPR